MKPARAIGRIVSGAYDSAGSELGCAAPGNHHGEILVADPELETLLRKLIELQTEEILDEPLTARMALNTSRRGRSSSVLDTVTSAE